MFRSCTDIQKVGLIGILIWTFGYVGCSPAGGGTSVEDNPEEAQQAAEQTGNEELDTQTKEDGQVVTTPPSNDPIENTDACVSNQQFFVEKIWTPFLATDCGACHQSLGAAKNTRLILRDGYSTGFLVYNMDVLEEVASYEKNGTPLLLLKPLGEDNHGGGARLQKNSPEYQALKEMLTRFKSPVACENTLDQQLFNGVVTLNPVDTLRKASLALTGSIPSADDYQNVLAGGEKELVKALKAMMAKPTFFDWVKETYNELFMSRRYAHGNDAIDLINETDFPNKKWFEDCDNTDPHCMNEAFKALATKYTNWSVAESPLELVAHIVRNDLPFTEMVTANYTMVNSLSAKVFGADDMFFANPLDIHEFRATQLDVMRDDMLVKLPHAGVLTSPLWLKRFPTTESNVNRHRSRMVHLFFLATDVLKLAERAIDQATIKAHNPTMNESKCAVCHVAVDPVAGAFLNWDENGRYVPPETGWHSDMRPPGFEEEDIPKSDLYHGLQWLGDRITGDQRFVTSIVHTVFTALTGQLPIGPPVDTTLADYKTKLAVFMRQAEYFQTIGDAFAASNFNFKTVVTGIVMSPYFRASNLASRDEPATKKQLAALEEVGMGRLLRPEQLSRRISAVTGRAWTDNKDGTDKLQGKYLLHYGGVDFKTTTRRIVEPNGTIANIAERMANEMACRTVPEDFARPPKARLLFPLVEADFTPYEKHGFPVPMMIEKIKANIQYLHYRVLGEQVQMNSPALLKTFTLFLAAWSTGREHVKSKLYNKELPTPCQVLVDPETGEAFAEGDTLTKDANFTIRAWMAVMSYLLSDYKFLYE